MKLIRNHQCLFIMSAYMMAYFMKMLHRDRLGVSHCTIAISICVCACLGAPHKFLNDNTLHDSMQHNDKMFRYVLLLQIPSSGSPSQFAQCISRYEWNADKCVSSHLNE